MPEPGPSSRGDDRTDESPAPRSVALRHIAAAVDGVRYGEVRVIIQDGVVVQIERVEKQRLR